MADTERVDTGNPDGGLFGIKTTDKIGFYGITPVVQQVAGTLATTAPTSTSPFGYTQAQAQAILNAVLALQTLGLVG